MKLLYLDRAAVDDLKTNFSNYRNHFTDITNDWFMEIFRKNNWIHESRIQCDILNLDFDEDYNRSDRKNIEIIYNALNDLSPANASDERLWAGVLFGQLWDFARYRRAKELNSGNERDILNTFVFMNHTKKSAFINCLSRLWWAGHLFYDPERSYHYAAINLITDHAFPSNLFLLSSSNFMSNKKLALGIMDCIAERKERGEKIGRFHFVEATRYLNCIGGITLLDTLSRDEIKSIVGARLDKLFGIL